MRNIKKIAAIFLTIAMVFSLVSTVAFADTTKAVSVKFRAADGTTEVHEQKSGKIVYADLYVTEATYNALWLQFDATTGSEINDEEDVTVADFPGSDFTVAGKKVTVEFGKAGKTFTVTNQPVASIKLTVPDTVGEGIEMVKFNTSINYTILSESSEPKTFDTVTNGTIKVVEGFDVASAVAVKDGAEVTQTAPIAVGMGTSLTKAVEGVTATLKNSDGTKTDIGYKIDWDANTDYDPNNTTAVQEVTGKVTVDGKKTANATTEPVPVKAYIQVGKINIATDTDVVIDKVKDVTFKATKEAGAVTEADILTEAAKRTSVAVKKGADYTGTLTLSGWAVSGETKTLDSLTVSTVENDVPTANFVTLTATATASGDIFEGTKPVTFYAYVVKAEIDGGSISIGSVVDNSKLQVRVTIPANQFEAGQKVVATVYSGDTAKGSKEITIPEDTDTTKPYETTINFDDSMKTLGFTNAGTKGFSVKVTVAGTELKNGTGDDATTTVTGEVKKATTGNAGGIHKGGSTTTTYAVTVVETKNGTATVSPEKAASGATVTVKPEPAEGYKVKSVTAVKADGTNVPVDEKAYTFTMPASAVKVTVEFEEGKDEPSVDPTPAEDKFADVADDFWAAKDIYTLKDAGIIGGKSATEFDPEGDVTRAEFAKMVVGLFGYKATSDAVNFEDCKAEDWFTPYVAAGVEAGVIKGVSDTEFAPNATITREDACTILGRALNKVAQSNELKFTDADKVAEYAAPYVALLSELGYVNGYEDGSFAPANNITRAEAAKIIAGIYNAKNTTVTEDKTDAADTTDANVEGENTTAPVEENAEDKADTTDTIDVAPEK